MKPITPCLWFDGNAEDAVEFYTDIFPNSRITAVSRYGEAGYEIHGNRAGTVMTIAFELNGKSFTALNGGPQFQFNEAVSFQVSCETQSEIDRYWDKLSEGGDENAQQCGWLKDRFGVSWQIVPAILEELIHSDDQNRSERVMNALLQMKKLEIAKLQQAYGGEVAG